MRCEHYVSHRIFLLGCRVWNCDFKWCGLYMGIDIYYVQRGRFYLIMIL